MMRSFFTTLFLFLIFVVNAQSWQDVGGGTNNSSHGLLTYNGKLVNLGSYNNPCNRVATWDGTTWDCLGGGVGIVARAGVVWNGNLVVVGDFWNNFQPCAGCNGVAVWDGTQWTALDQGFNNDVLTCTVYNGDLIIGGDFTQANGVPISRVARWNSTTQTFESMGTPTSFDNDVRCMVEFNGELYVGGDFNNVDGNPPSDGLVKWDTGTQSWTGGNSGVDLVGGVNETVRVLYVNPNDGNLYMGGHFPELIDGDSINPDYNMSGVAMYDGSNWFPLGTGLNDYCRAIHEYNGDVIVGGYFTTADGVACNKIAKWNTTTQTFSPMGLGFDGVGIDEYVKSATTWNGIFFAGGAYTQCEGNSMNYIAQWYEPPTSSPTAAFSPSSSMECEGGCINFTDVSTNNPTSWSWTFPGSSTPTSNLQHPLNICYPTAGSYTAKLVTCNGNGCDSTTVNITINGATVANPPALIGCDSLLYNSVMYYTSTMVSDTTFGGSSNGCDSITNQQLTISNVVVANPPVLSGCDSVLYNSVMYYTSTMVNDTSFGGSVNGCDSITNQQITIGNTAVANLPVMIGCDSVLYNSVMYYASGTVSDTAFGGAVSGCDSITNQPITINSSVVTNQPPVVACDSALVNWTWYYTSQTVSDYFPGAAVNGCDSTAITVVTINGVDATTVTNNDSITANASGASYQWLDCNNGYAVIPGETSQLFVASSNGDYAVQVTQNGCTDTSACVTITITAVTGDLLHRDVDIYPNPTTRLINVKLGREQEAISYVLMALDGRIIEQQQVTTNTFNIDLNDESNGVYLLKLRFNDAVKVYKVFKQ